MYVNKLVVDVILTLSQLINFSYSLFILVKNKVELGYSKYRPWNLIYTVNLGYRFITYLLFILERKFMIHEHYRSLNGYENGRLFQPGYFS